MTHADPEIGSSGVDAAPLVSESGNLPAILAETSEARLPATYEAARRAVEECESLDEVKSWQDKVAALKAYARMRDDDTLRVLAVRIAARAARRFGELAKQFPRGDELTRFGVARARQPVKTQAQAAKEAGASGYQLKTALRVAAMPEGDFNRQVESPEPPTVRQLAEGGGSRRASGKSPASTRDAFRACESLRMFAQSCERSDPIESARAVNPQDVEALARYVAIADRWLDRFASNLTGVDE